MSYYDIGFDVQVKINDIDELSDLIQNYNKIFLDSSKIYKVIGSLKRNNKEIQDLVWERFKNYKGKWMELKNINDILVEIQKEYPIDDKIWE